jgi:hypothetical protein
MILLSLALNEKVRHKDPKKKGKLSRQLFKMILNTKAVASGDSRVVD